MTQKKLFSFRENFFFFEIFSSFRLGLTPSGVAWCLTPGERSGFPMIQIIRETHLEQPLATSFSDLILVARDLIPDAAVFLLRPCAVSLLGLLP